MDRFETALTVFQARFPNTQLECLIAECGDLVDLVQSGRAQRGFVEQQGMYPKDIASKTVAETTESALYVAPNHTFAILKGWIALGTRRQHCQLQLSTLRQVPPG